MIMTDREVKHQEKENILSALRRCGSKVFGEGGAAELLGVKPTMLSSRIEKIWH